MLAVLLLCAAVCRLGSSRDSETVLYGERFRIRLSRTAQDLTFWPGLDVVYILWTSEDGLASLDPRHSLDGGYFVINQMTQLDTGQYNVWEKNYSVSSVDISVVANQQTYDLTPGDSVNFQYDLPFTSCNVFFTPEGYLRKGAEIVRRGRVQYRRNCRAFSISQPCKFNIEGGDTSCSGTYEIKDDKENTALQVTLTVRDHSDLDSYGLVGIAAFISPALCFCLKCCCCRKSGLKKDSSDSEGSDADSTQMQCKGEPVRLGPTVEELPYPAGPPLTPTAPLILNSHHSQPPSYEEAMALTEETSGSPHFFTSTAEPRVGVMGVQNCHGPHVDI
ncbi:uncharacterized protein LOC128767651 isoform X2 [Synchiropus splendidus]|uniref:uncharacterized protein LOC128767651 isoform X2 n=1 Tax=Synchiropus splendidus TaxID=270530 RepID=UPI00237E0B18|nr:uncharacterized protein LOC128767651 isoform X2 [Synchiropus splendidus]